jgi:hypothetical protein
MASLLYYTASEKLCLTVLLPDSKLLTASINIKNDNCSYAGLADACTFAKAKQTSQLQHYNDRCLLHFLQPTLLFFKHRSCQYF